VFALGGYHLQMNSNERIESLTDYMASLYETVSPDPLTFKDQKSYPERLKEAQQRTALQDAVQTGTGLIDGIPMLGLWIHFKGGSMGSVVVNYTV
jgi:acetyl-CoA carboxylase carboxyl transferase subunit beta